MAELLTPQGYEDAETLKDSDLMEVYQDPSAGVRNNKKARLDFLRDFFKKLPVFTANNLVQADGTGTLRTTSLSTTEVSNTVTRSQNNETAIGVLDQRVDDNDNDIGNNANSIGVNAGNISSNDGDISTLQGRATTLENKTPQSYKITDTITLVDLVLTGVASVASSIISLLSRMTATEGATGTNTTNIGTNTTNIGNNATNIGTNDTDITNLQGRADDLEEKTPQSYKTTDDVTFATVNTGFGDNDVLPAPTVSNKANISTPYTLPTIVQGQENTVAVNLASGSGISVSLPTDGAYSVYYTMWDNSLDQMLSQSISSLSSGSLVLTLFVADNALITYTLL